MQCRSFMGGIFIACRNHNSLKFFISLYTRNQNSIEYKGLFPVGCKKLGFAVFVPKNLRVTLGYGSW